MKIIKPSDFVWVFALQKTHLGYEPFLKLLEVEKVGFDPKEQEWVLFDHKEDVYYADECIEAPFNIIDEKLDRHE